MGAEERFARAVIEIRREERRRHLIEIGVGVAAAGVIAVVGLRVVLPSVKMPMTASMPVMPAVIGIAILSRIVGGYAKWTAVLVAILIQAAILPHKRSLLVGDDYLMWLAEFSVSLIIIAWACGRPPAILLVSHKRSSLIDRISQITHRFSALRALGQEIIGERGGAGHRFGIRAP